MMTRFLVTGVSRASASLRDDGFVIVIDTPETSVHIAGDAWEAEEQESNMLIHAHKDGQTGIAIEALHRLTVGRPDHDVAAGRYEQMFCAEFGGGALDVRIEYAPTVQDGETLPPGDWQF